MGIFGGPNSFLSLFAWQMLMMTTMMALDSWGKGMDRHRHLKMKKSRRWTVHHGKSMCWENVEIAFPRDGLNLQVDINFSYPKGISNRRAKLNVRLQLCGHVLGIAVGKNVPQFPFRNNSIPIRKRPFGKQYQMLLMPLGYEPNLMEEKFEQSENFRHFCKVCKKRFTCGKALGGHMRIHGAAASAPVQAGYNQKKRRCRVSGTGASYMNKNFKLFQKKIEHNLQRIEDGGYSFAERSEGGFVSKSIGSNFLRNLRICDECGKEFTSWNALIDHRMRCHSDRLSEKVHNPTEAKDEFWKMMDNQSDTKIVEITSGHSPILNPRSSECWIKGKRSRRPKYVFGVHHQPNSEERDPNTFVSHQNEEEETAHCLVMLSNAGGLWGPATREVEIQGEEQSSTSQSMDIRLPIAEENASELDKFSKRRDKMNNSDNDQESAAVEDVWKERSYECKRCKRHFDSYQALGGHRASHNKVKGSSSARINMQDEIKRSEEGIITADDDKDPSTEDHHELLHHFPPSEKKVSELCISEERIETLGAPKKAKVHECSICKKMFASGQALGGHKRCHWIPGGTDSDKSSIQRSSVQQQSPLIGEWLDLNLPAPLDGESYREDGIAVPNNLVEDVMDSGYKNRPFYTQPWWVGSNQSMDCFPSLTTPV
eukprot:Gb_40151 [translate_table: standard]